MFRARWATLAVAALVALLAAVAGCGSSEQSTDVEKIAFVAPFQDNEPDWTKQAQAVVDAFPKDLGIRVDTADASQTDDLRGVLEQVSHEDNQLVIAHDSRYADTAEAVAKDTDVPELVWGERSDPPDGLIGEITVQDKEGGYLAGIAAAKAAFRRSHGILVADDGSDWDLATWNRMAGGYVAGARSIDPRSKFAYRQIGTDGNATAAEMRAAAERMIRQGVQMIFVLGGNAALGAQRAIEATEGADETLLIGAVSDKGTTRRVEKGTVPIMLGSVMIDTRPAFTRAVRDVRAGTFGEKPYALTLANRGVWLYATGRMPSDAHEEAIETGRRISSGEVEVPSTPTREAVEQLLTGGAPQG